MNLVRQKCKNGTCDKKDYYTVWSKGPPAKLALSRGPLCKVQSSVFFILPSNRRTRPLTPRHLSIRQSTGPASSPTVAKFACD